MTTIDNDSAFFKLCEIIREFAAREPRGYIGLADSIEKANVGAKKRGVERRKLSDLAKTESVPLSLDELDALNRFLIQERGIGLRTIFPSPTIIEAVTP